MSVKTGGQSFLSACSIVSEIRILLGMGTDVHDHAKYDEVRKDRRSAIRDERQRDAGDRQQAADHAQILDLLIDEDAEHAADHVFF